MIIKQLSVFLENRAGRLTELTGILSKHGLNITALSLAETSEYGVVRMVVSDPESALTILKDSIFAVRLTEVVCVETPNSAGSLSRVLSILNDNGIAVEYLYAFSHGETAHAVIRTDNIAGTIEILRRHKVELLQSSRMYRLD